MSMDCTSCLTSPSCILGWLESENTAEVHTAVWESPVYPQALWTHTNRFKDNAVFIRQECLKNQKSIQITHNHHLTGPSGAPYCSMSHYTDVIDSFRQSTERYLFNMSVYLHTFTNKRCLSSFTCPALLFNILQRNICILLLSLPFMLYSTV